MGFSVLQANLLTIPSQLLNAINLVLLGRLSDKLNERSFVASITNLWILPWLLTLILLPPDTNNWIRYVILTGLLSYPFCTSPVNVFNEGHPLLAGWNAQISNTVRTRAISAVLYNMNYQAGQIIGTNIYRDDDRPFYPRGNRILLGICVYNIVLCWITKAYYVWRNKRRDAEWKELSRDEKMQYILTTKDEGNKRLNFRFVH
jgi:hypothetical protein